MASMMKITMNTTACLTMRKRKKRKNGRNNSFEKTKIYEKDIVKDTIMEVDEELAKTLEDQGKAKIHDSK